MNKRVAALSVGGVWLAGIGLVVAVAFARPRPIAAGEDSTSVQGESHLLPIQDEMVWSSELELPTVVVVGNVSGAAEMQGKDDVTIGPGTVTYP